MCRGVIRLTSFIRLVLLFFLYSFAGWCIEVILKFIQFHRFINRGFLTGPICPIYGTGAVLITIFTESLTSVESSYGTTFLISFLLCGSVEYLTSYYMEKRFHARWWDYSQKPMNLHGRVWIGNLVLFGLGGIMIHHLINPALYQFFDILSLPWMEIIAGCMTITFITDYIATHFVLKLVRIGVESSQADNTEEISREVRLLLSDKSYFYRRFVDAYPDVIYKTERIRARAAEIKAETERLRKEAEQRVEERARLVASELEPSTLIKNTIIRKQDMLIDMLFEEQSMSNAAIALKKDIDREKARLEARPLEQIMSGRPAKKPAGFPPGGTRKHG